jgi:hypothetical protein
VAWDDPHVSVGGLLEQECLENNVENETDQTKKETVPHFEKNQHMQQDLRKSDANVDKPSQVRVRFFGFIVRV